MSHKLFQLEWAGIRFLFKVVVALGCLSVIVIVANTVVLYIRNKDKDECFKQLKRGLISLYDNTIGFFVDCYIEAIKHVFGIK